MTMTEQEIKELAEREAIAGREVVNRLQLPPEETPMDFIGGKKARDSARDSRKLRWYERQYGAGFLNGLWCGIAVGFPLAAGVAALCKVFVGWLMAW